MALFDELDRLLGENESNLDALAGFLEADPAGTRRLLDCAVPALLGGLAHRTQSDRGAAAVYDLVKDHDGVLVQDVAGFVRDGDPEAIGSSLVGSILGRRRNLVEQQLAATSGLGVGSVAKFLPVITPLVISYLGQKVARGGLNDGGLASMLDDNLASMAVAENEDVLTALGEVAGDVEAADASFLAGLSRVVGIGGLSGLVGVGAQMTTAMPTLERVQAPRQFRDAIEADDELGDEQVLDGAPLDEVAADEIEADDAWVPDEIEAADAWVPDEIDIDAATPEEASANLAFDEREVVQDVTVDESDSDVDVDLDVTVDDDAVGEDAPASVAMSAETKRHELKTESVDESTSGTGWVKWLFPLVALALLAWLIVALMSRGPDEIVGNDLGGHTLTIGVESMVDGDTEGAGWDFDVWHEVCGVIDCKAEFVAAPWPGVLDQVAAGEVEAAINGISITEERKSRVDFSDPYLTIEQKMLVAGDNDLYASTTDVIDDQGALIGAQAGTVEYELAQRLVPENRIETYEGFEAVVAALIAGEVDAVVFEDASGVGYAGAAADQLRPVEGTFGSDDLGFVFQPGSEYIGPVNHAIAELRANGRLDELAREYLAAP